MRIAPFGRWAGAPLWRGRSHPVLAIVSVASTHAVEHNPPRRNLLPACLLVASLGVLAVGGTSAAGTDDAALVRTQRGTLPLILTAPHGGNTPIPGVAPRTTGTVVGDARTIELTDRLAAELGARLCGSPYVVEALFARRYVDANRPAAEAYESPLAVPYYAAYHQAIRADVDEVRASYGSPGLLVDVHGQDEEPGRVHRGTQDGKSVAGLLQRAGPDGLIGPDSVFGRLQAAGYDVFPPNTPLRQPREDRRFNGGYTVQTYGSDRPDGLDAIQIETGSTFRQPDTLAPYAADLADAVAAYYRAYVAGGDPCAAGAV